MWYKHVTAIAKVCAVEQPTGETPAFCERRALHPEDEPVKNRKRLTSQPALVLRAIGSIVGPLRRCARLSGDILECPKVSIAPEPHELGGLTFAVRHGATTAASLKQGRH